MTVSQTAEQVTKGGNDGRDAVEATFVDAGESGMLHCR
jgi:hypothetical protein